MKMKIKKWQIGAIIGGIWGLLGILLYIADIKNLTSNFPEIIAVILGFPLIIASNLGLHPMHLFYGAIIIGVLIGGIVGYLIDKLRKIKSEKIK